MIGSDDKEIVIAKQGEHFSELFVKGGHSPCVALKIVSVSVYHIEVNKVDEAKTVEVALHNINSLITAVVVAYSGIAFGEADACEYIVDLAYRDRVVTGVLKLLGNGETGGRERKIVSAGGSLEGILAVEGTCDDTAYAVLTLKKLTRDLAVAIELLAGYERLVRRNLEYAVCGGVNNELSAL